MALLLAGCEEITSWIDDPPTAKNVALSGTLTVGQTLTGSYKYYDPNTDPEGTSTFRWYRASDSAGTGAAAISGATALTYTLVDADADETIAFEVTPVAKTGEKLGTAVRSAFTSSAVTAP